MCLLIKLTEKNQTYFTIYLTDNPENAREPDHDITYMHGCNTPPGCPQYSEFDVICMDDAAMFNREENCNDEDNSPWDHN